MKIFLQYITIYYAPTDSISSEKYAIQSILLTLKILSSRHNKIISLDKYLKDKIILALKNKGTNTTQKFTLDSSRNCDHLKIEIEAFLKIVDLPKYSHFPFERRLQ